MERTYLTLSKRFSSAQSIGFGFSTVRIALTRGETPHRARTPGCIVAERSALDQLTIEECLPSEIDHCSQE
jgi:hypothetical protein